MQCNWHWLTRYFYFHVFEDQANEVIGVVQV